MCHNLEQSIYFIKNNITIFIDVHIPFSNPIYNLHKKKKSQILYLSSLAHTMSIGLLEGSRQITFII